jgi:sugar/nucleoside kinase (ribokinase family)
MSAPTHPGAVLCLGEALVDLICEEQIEQLAPDRARFVPHFGGVVANVAVIAARHGARVRLLGSAGEDAWGRWLRDRLVHEDVDTSLFTLDGGVSTPLALVTIAPGGEPTYRLWHEPPELGEADVEAAVDEAAGVFIGTNTLVGERERAMTMRARELALELERPVILDPNIRLHRWRSRAEAAAQANSCVAGSLLVRANQVEAELMTGEKDPERAALALAKAGARMVVITLGERGAILRGELRAEAPGSPAHVLSTVGGGDVLTGVLLARLATSGFYPPAVAASLPEAVVESARACERWGALD